MTSTSILMSEQSFYNTSPVQNYPTSPNYFQVPSYSDSSNDMCLEQEMDSLEIVLQPCNKFRFRYKSESGSHGKLRGELPETKPKSKTNFPTVKFNHIYASSAKIQIKASLYTDEESPKPHILQLVGKNCINGECWEPLSKDNTAMFRFLEIENKKNEDAISILLTEKIKRAGRRCNKEALEKEAKEEFKTLNMNSVKLCFQAFLDDMPISGQVFSNPIKNLKSASSDLKITRISRCAGSWEGGDEVFLLCEKINKDDIEIHFYEKDECGEILWEDKGSFIPKADVHHQVAIVFKTPKYLHSEGGTVCMELHRPSDKQGSDPLLFTYIPDEFATLRESKKRKLNTSESVESGFGYASTSSGYDSSSPGVKMEDNSSFGGSPYQGVMEDDFTTLFNSTFDQENLAYLLSTGILDQDSDVLMPPNQPIVIHNSSASGEMDEVECDAAVTLGLHPNQTNQEEFIGDSKFNDHDYSTFLPEPTFQKETTDRAESGYKDKISLQQFQYNSLPSNSFVKTITESFKYLGSFIAGVGASPTTASGIGVRNDIEFQSPDPEPYRDTRTITVETQMAEEECGTNVFRKPFDKKVYGQMVGGKVVTNISSKLSDNKIRWNMADSKAGTNVSSKPSDNKIHMAGEQSGTNVLHKPSGNKIYGEMADMDLCLDMKNLSFKDNNKTVLRRAVKIESSILDDHHTRKPDGISMNPKFEKFKEGIRYIIENREEKVYLQYVSKLMSVTDADGNTLLHLAVREQSMNVNLILKLLKMCPEFVNKQNNFRETPLHLACKVNAYKVVLALLSGDGNSSIVDAKGNNCFHIASESNFAESMAMLLSPKLKHGKHMPSVDDFNYEGWAPLHLAVLNNAKECMKLLLRAGADVNVRDRKSGSSPLYLAMKHKSSLVQDLLSHPGVDLFNENFHGDTFVHALCNLKRVLEPRVYQPSTLISWAQKTWTLPSIDTDEVSSEDSDSDNNGTESDYEDETETNDSRENPVFAQPLITNNVDENFLSEECEERLRIYLDDSSAWRQLGLFIGLDEKCLDGLARLSRNSSPSKVVLRKAKGLYGDLNKPTLINILTAAGLHLALKALD